MGVSRHTDERLSFEPPPVDFDPAARGHKSCLDCGASMDALDLAISDKCVDCE